MIPASAIHTAARGSQKLTAKSLTSSSSATIRSIVPHRLLHHELEMHSKSSPRHFQRKTDRPCSRLGTLCLNNDLRSEEQASFVESCEQCTDSLELHAPG
ncbi:unnamed protein product [Echinostoma caproni]|uniref:Integron gene cassette protein n=1 Tax=Echinostoma caproni TaxID=27848 RepID=A0A183A5D8_9TREM|nr:unnamed protein product [Echinostoma caproni]